MNKYFQIVVVLVSIAHQSNQSSEFVYKSYQTSIYCTPSTQIQSPSTIQEIVDIVRYASANGQTVKAIGSRHSITDVICTDGTPLAMHSESNIN